ncbi:GatB/YqeY domain-containing protein [Skermania piniformis]|uniref:GatB/YqeY domain-containing protein n=1 Tax=Skermania pinensis TaxID=39122 RepID=A0ABX8S9P4_9ACTN|nr:GatB/YqeY domain-containing protein [Skermania piniformis]QXQ14186.1 GatB/YqeY domain-containing protein [Skermania piniformis]
MAELKARLRSDLTAAMKAKDTVRTQTLRMLLAGITNAEVAGDRAQELADVQVVEVLAKEAKKRAEAAKVFADAGRAELAAKERDEAEIIDEYLPAKLSDDELGAVADAAVAQITAELGAVPTVRQMGQVMRVATGLAAGRADGARLAAAVKTRL